MGRQIWLLTKVSLCNLFGLNEFRFTRDKKKKSRYYLMGALWLLVLLVLVSYVGVACYGMIVMGAGELMPALLVMCVSVITFLFTMIKAGPVLFDNKAFEKQIAFPVEIKAIIVSRFLSMYLMNMLSGMLIMIPGMAVYGLMEKPGIAFYLYGLAGSLFLPFLPLTIASVAGAVIAGIGSRWKDGLKKNLVMTSLTMLFVCGILVGSFGMAGVEESSLEAAVRQIVFLLGEQIRRTYPPALWLSRAMTEGNGLAFLLFAGVPMGIFAIFLGIISRFYDKICRALSAGAVKSQGAYSVKAVRVKSPLRAMTGRELRRYFSSVVYVTNTMVGELMMVILAVAVAVTGTEKIDTLLGLSGVVERTLPVLLGMLPAMMPMTTSSISMEGKWWWMMQTFPVSERALVRSKLSANLAVIFPFYLVSEICLLFALKPDAKGALSLLVVPAVYIVFSGRAGLWINMRFPVFDWENEIRVVKQSTAVFLMLLAGMLSGAVPAAVLIGARSIPAELVYIVTIAVLLLVSAAIEREFRKSKLSGQS